MSWGSYICVYDADLLVRFEQIGDGTHVRKFWLVRPATPSWLTRSATALRLYGQEGVEEGASLSGL